MAIAFTWLMVGNVYILRSKGGAYTRDKTTLAMHAGDKNAGGLMREGGVIAGPGFYWNKISIVYKFHQMNYNQCFSYRSTIQLFSS